MPNPIVVARRVRGAGGRSYDRHLYWCPGCDTLHSVSIRPHPQGSGPGWTFDGTLDKPSYWPSQLTTWEDERGKHVCHTFIREGRIEFLGDCTHRLRNRTVDLPPLPDWIVDEPEDAGAEPEGGDGNGAA